MKPAGDDDLTTCPSCGAQLHFDPTLRGMTCGGLELEGWLVCPCGQAFIGSRSRPAESWKLAKGGRSVDTGTARIRAEAGEDVEGLMRRLVRLPELERALRRIAKGDEGAAAIAAEVLLEQERR